MQTAHKVISIDFIWELFIPHFWPIYCTHSLSSPYVFFPCSCRRSTCHSVTAPLDLLKMVSFCPSFTDPLGIYCDDFPPMAPFKHRRGDTAAPWCWERAHSWDLGGTHGTLGGQGGEKCVRTMSWSLWAKTWECYGNSMTLGNHVFFVLWSFQVCGM